MATTDLEANAKDFEASDREKPRKHLQYQISMSMLLTFAYQFAKENAWNFVTMACIGAFIPVIYLLKPAAYRMFPVYSNNGQIVYPQFAYPPHNGFIVPIWLATFLPLFIPTATFLLMQFRVRSFWDLNNAFIGLIYSLLLSTVFTVALKHLVGGMRPHFLSVCDPDPSLVRSGQGFEQMMFTRDICRGKAKDVNFAVTSFPSGHTASAFAGFGYLFLYLNAKLKVWSNYHPAFWKLALLYAPILGAVLIACSVVVDYNHNWYDAVAGGIIGIVMAFSAYRVVWASIWDFRYNHIPLKRHIHFNYHGSDITSTALSNYTWTRKAGWGPAERGLRSEPEESLYGTAGAAGVGSGQATSPAVFRKDQAGDAPSGSNGPAEASKAPGATGSIGASNKPTGAPNVPTSTSPA